MATYFDSVRQSKIDYTNVKKVLDDVLPNYAKSGGTFTRLVRKYGKHVFAHNTTFCCIKQPPGGQKGAYYAIHHMRAIIRDHHHLLLPDKLKDWAASLSEIQYADIRQEFFRIQSEFADIIHQDVLHTSGQFISTASTCCHTIRSSAASSSRLAVRRMPTTPSITCGRS